MSRFFMSKHFNWFKRCGMFATVFVLYLLKAAGAILKRHGVLEYYYLLLQHSGWKRMFQEHDQSLFTFFIYTATNKARVFPQISYLMYSIKKRVQMCSWQSAGTLPNATDAGTLQGRGYQLIKCISHCKLSVYSSAVDKL